MVDPAIHAKMTILIQQEKKLQDELATIRGEIPTWEKRVQLAKQRGMTDLAQQAQERADQLAARIAAIEHECEVIEMDKEMLRYEAKRPSGIELERAEALLDSIRVGGLIDPDGRTSATDKVTLDLNEED